MDNNSKDLLNILDEDDDIEIINVGSDSSSEEDDENDSPKKFKISFHLIFALLVLTIFVIIGVYLLRWNSRSAKVDSSDILPDQFDMENLDYYIYPDPEIMATRTDDGENNILFIGNSILTYKANGKTLIEALSDKIDGNVYCIATDTGKIASNRPAPEGPTSNTDQFSFVRLANAFAASDYSELIPSLYHSGELFYYDKETRADELEATMLSIDPDKLDAVVIMYSLIDYYQSVPTLTLDEEQVNSYYGALYTSVRNIQTAYPHLSIIISSPTQSYLLDENGNIVLANLKDYGLGNGSAYVDMMYYVATKCCVSYIDNYFYGITDSNITEYIEDFYLTEKGINLVSTHIANFINNPSSVSNEVPMTLEP